MAVDNFDELSQNPHKRIKINLACEGGLILEFNKVVS